MANEGTVNALISIRKGRYIDYASRPSSFRFTVDGAKGPVPGALTITPQGVDIDFSELEIPAVGRIMNCDDPTTVTSNFITVGIWDPEEGKFHPLLEILPGESWPMRLSRYLNQEYGTGTGSDTIGEGTSVLRLKSETANATALVEFFEQ